MNPFEHLAVYCVGSMPKTKAVNRYLVVFSNYLTRWPEVFCTKSIEATVIAQLIVGEIIPRHGPPEWLLSDLGSNFMSAIVTELLRLVNTGRLRTSSYHPQTDGLVERLNGSLCQSLSMYTNAKGNDWDQYVPSVVHAYRVQPTDSLKVSPFKALYGRDARLILDTDLLQPSEAYSGPADYCIFLPM